MMSVSRLSRYLLLVLGLVPVAVNAGPEIIQWTTRNGAEVLYVHAPEIPIVDIRVVFDAGSARDGNRSGLARLTSALLSEGAGELDADAFNERMAATGASFGHSALRDMAWVSLRSMTDDRYLQPALELMQLALTAPRFADDAVTRQRERTLAGIRRSEESPGRIAEKAFYAALYREHPYATPVEGTLESVAALQAEHLREFHARYYTARNATVAVVGAVSRRTAARLVEGLLDELPAGSRPAALPPVPPLAQAEEVFIAHDSVQSHVRLGQPGITRTDPDYFPLVVGNHVLGGNGLVSILFEEVRDKRGLSYSVYSYFSPMAAQGPFLSGLQTDNSQVDEARTVLRDTLAGFIAHGPEPAALDEAKRNLIGGFPLRISSNAKIIEYIAMIGFYGLPLDYLDTYTRKVAQVTVDDVREAFQRRVEVDKMVSVTVGAGS